MKTVSALLLVILHAILSSCSCAIYHQEYKVSPKVLDDDFKLAKLASKKAGYKEADRGLSNRAWFYSKNITLAFGEDDSISSGANIWLYSPFCIFIPFNMDVDSWENRCAKKTKAIEDEFAKLGYPVTQVFPNPTYQNMGVKDVAPPMYLYVH